MAFNSSVRRTNSSIKLNLLKNVQSYNYFDSLTLPNQFLSDVTDYLINDKESNYSLKTISYPEIEKEGYMAQGITIIDDKTFISAHGKGDSKLFIYDNITGKYIGYINLDQTSHVGGTTFDKDNNILYVTNGGGKYSTYDYNVIKKIIENENNYSDGILKYDLKSINNISKEEFEQILRSSNDEEIQNLVNTYDMDTLYDTWSEGKSQHIYDKITHLILQTHSEAINNNLNANCTASTTCFHDGLLYTCHFVGTKSGEMDILRPIYTTNEYGDTVITYERVNTELIKIPPRVQGIAVTEYEGKQYILFSQSIGEHNDSSITVYEVTEDGEYINRGIKYFEEDGMEGINVDENGIITACFEFEKKTMTMDMESLLNDLDEENDIKNFWPHLKQKVGGIYWDTGSGSTVTKTVSALQDLYKKPGLDSITSAFFTLKGAESDVIKFVEYTIVPESWRENKVVKSTMDTIDYGLDAFKKDFYYTYADQIKEHGFMPGLLRGSIVNFSTTKTKIANFGFKSLATLGQGGAFLINKGADLLNIDYQIDLEIFDKAKDYVDKKFDKAITTTKNVVDYGLDVAENVWDHTGGALCKKAKSVLPFL